MSGGPRRPRGKLVSPGFEGWDALADYTLVEADGSAGKPFKGHEKHEPVLPGATPPFWCWEPTASAVPSALRPIVRPCIARLAGVPENRPRDPGHRARVAARGIS